MFGFTSLLSSHASSRFALGAESQIHLHGIGQDLKNIAHQLIEPMLRQHKVGQFRIQRQHAHQLLILLLHFIRHRLARHLGSAREVVTRMLKYFQGEGLVRLERGSIALLDLPGLEALAADSLR